MRREKLLTRLKKLFLFLITLLLFYACETDDFLKESSTAVNANQEHSKITQLTFKDIESNPMLLEVITQLKSKNISNNITQRGEFNNTFQMELDTTQIFKVESEWRHSYTFRIIEDTLDTNITRNLVLSYAGNYNSYYAYIASYDLSEQEKLDMKLGNPVDLNSKITMQTYNPNYTTFSNVLEDNSDCFENIQIGGDICPSGLHNMEQMNNGKCDHVNDGSYIPSAFPMYEVLVSLNCLDSGGSTGDPINDDPIAWEPTEPIDGPGGGGPRDGEVTINNPSDPPDDSGNDDSEQEDPFLDAPETVINFKGAELQELDPCDQLNSMTVEKSKIIDSLKTRVDDAKEHGFVYRSGEDPEYIVASSSYEPTLKMPSGGTIYGFSHTHPSVEDTPDDMDKTMPMFSLSDIMWLALAYQYHEYPKPPASKFVITMTVETGMGIEHFAIKIESYYTFISCANEYWSLSKRDRRTKNNTLTDNYSTVYENYQLSTDEYVKTLFNTLNDDDDIDYGGFGVYKATDENMSDWEKLEPNYDNNGKVVDINNNPC